LTSIAVTLTVSDTAIASRESRAAAMDDKTFKRHRKRLKASQSEIANTLGVHRFTVSKWERGVHPVSETAARLIARLTPADIKRRTKRKD